VLDAPFGPIDDHHPCIGSVQGWFLGDELSG
jgi:hypothetical protein